MKKDRFRWNLSIFHWCVDTNQRGYKSVRIHKATPIHARMYLAEKAKKNFKKKFLKKKFQKKNFKKKKKKISKTNFFQKIFRAF